MSVCMVCVVCLVNVYGKTYSSICDMAWFVSHSGVFVGVCCDVFDMYVFMVSVSGMALICVVYMIWYVCTLYVSGMVRCVICVVCLACILHAI